MTLREMQVYQQQADTGAVRKALRGAAIGNTVEWFDFAIYGFLATDHVLDLEGEFEDAVVNPFQRGYLGGEHGFKRFQEARFNINCWWPTYTVTAKLDGAQETTTLGTITKDRTKYVQPFYAAAYNVTNVNDDFLSPEREDYSVLQSGAAWAINLGSGVQLGLHQDARYGYRCYRNARAVRLKIQCTTGRVRVLQTRVQGRATPTKLKPTV